MGQERAHEARRRVRDHLVDCCLLAAVLLVLALSWQGPPDGARDSLGNAARKAVSRQVGASPAAVPEPGPASGHAATTLPRGGHPG